MHPERNTTDRGHFARHPKFEKNGRRVTEPRESYVIYGTAASDPQSKFEHGHFLYKLSQGPKCFK